MIRRRVLQGAIALLATAALATSASASLRVRVEDLTTHTGVVLTGAGVVNYVGTISPTFTLTFTSGTSNALTGVPPQGDLNLSSFTLDSTGAGDLQITLEDDSYFVPGSGTSALTSSTSVTFAGGASTLVTQGWANANNATPGLGPNQPAPGPLGAIAMVGGTSPGPVTLTNLGVPPTFLFSTGANQSTTFSHPNSLYSLFMQETVHFTGAGNIQIGHSVSVVPEAGTLASMGMLLGLGGLFGGRGLRLRKRQAAA